MNYKDLRNVTKDNEEAFDNLYNYLIDEKMTNDLYDEYFRYQKEVTELIFDLNPDYKFTVDSDIVKRAAKILLDDVIEE